MERMNPLGMPATQPTPPVQPMDAAMPMVEPAPAEPVIGKAEVREAHKIFEKYRSGKAMLDKRVIESEQWWKLRHWDYMNKSNPHDAMPASSWLFNLIMSKHADALDAYPEPNILPREKDDKLTAKMLTAIVPVVLEQNDFEICYDKESWQKLVQGTGIFGVFWDKDKHNGLGDIQIRKIDALNIFWEPGITDIQDSRHLFTLELIDRDVLQEMYAEVDGIENITGQGVSPNKYLYDDTVDLSDKAVVIDWYYHKIVNGQRLLHYVKFVDEVVLYATENDPELSARGLYDHANYPFVFDPLFPIEGSPCGYGYIDIGKNVQARIDALNQNIDRHARMIAYPRWFVRGEGSVNEEEFADWSKPFIHVPDMQLGQDSIRALDVPNMDGNVINILNNLIVELKETTGNRDVSNGGSESGVTAASAIAAMQEQSGKTSKASARRTYMAYRQMVVMVIELVRQFYALPRQFRIVGRGSQEEFITFSNQGLAPQTLNVAGLPMGERLPVFDVDVSAQKMSNYTKVAQNELALQMYQMGLLAPQNADQALALLDIMDFQHKDIIEEKVRQNGTMLQMLMMYQQMAITLAQQTGNTQLAEQLAMNAMGSMQELGGGTLPGGEQTAQVAQGDALGGGLTPQEPKIVEKARARSQATTQPQA